MLKLGLTGSIATGKSTTAQLFADEGVPVHDADAAVHALYQQEGVAPVGELISSAIVDGVVNRPALKTALAADLSLFPKLEAIVHPLVQARESKACLKAQADGHAIMVFDIPLLFETGAQARMDKTVVVHCSPQTQMARLMARQNAGAGMSEETAQMLLARQMPQAEKMARADYLINTDHSVDDARRQVRDLLAALR